MRIPVGAPDAVAWVRGDGKTTGLMGVVKFYQMRDGTLVTADVTGLPETETDFFAFHIHEGCGCGGAAFAGTGGHYNPGNTAHPNHAGDLPPLLAHNGRASMAVLTGRFRVRDVLGRTVVIHHDPDDFHTQPAGNSGAKIACGVIRPADPL